MAHVHGDRVLETTTGTSSPWTLAGAVAGHRAFSAVATANDDTFYCCIRLGTQWEVMLAKRDSSTVISRVSFIASSTGSAITFAAGTKEVWMDIPARLLQMFTPSPNPAMINGNLFESHAADAVTFAVKTLAGANPSTVDPVFFIFPDTNGGVEAGTTIRIVTAALSITVPSGATLGVVNSKCPRIWIAAMDEFNTEAVELVVRNCYDDATKAIEWFPTADGVISTTAIGAGADSALVDYSVSSRSSLSFVVLGHFTYFTGLSVAGTWNVAPTRAMYMTPGMPKAGDIVQSRVANINTGVISTGSSNIMDSDVLVAITPKSFANAMRVTVYGGMVRTNNATSEVVMWLYNSTSGQVVGAAFPYGMAFPGLSNEIRIIGICAAGIDKPCSSSAQTYRVRFWDQATSGTFAEYTYGGYHAVITAEEIMI